MPGPEDASKPEPATPDGRFRKFIKFFEQGTAAAEKNAQISEALLGAIADEKDGLIKAIDDLADDLAALTDETRGLREDLRAFAQSTGIHVGFENLLGSMFNRRKGR